MRKGRIVTFVALGVCLHSTAQANVEKQLAQYEREAATLASNLPQPNQVNRPAERRLVDAQVAFALGDYDTAALALYDLASRPGAEQDAALFYLAESLHLKGEHGAARTHFARLIASNTGSKYYQPALLRLVEIAIATRDFTDVDTHLAALDRTTMSAEVPYVKGKLLYARGDLDGALAQFAAVPKGSEHELAAQYFAGTTHVAKKDYGQATNLFVDLTTRTPRSANDRRVMELAHLALGRLYYEQAQLAKSIDAYLMIDRRSDLFSDALYEVAWVYVKNKQYDKALRALELLHLSEPVSQKTPTVRILEGNLRIRKAQMIRAAQIQGVIEAKQESPEVEYDKARDVFAETHRLYAPSYAALSQLVDGNEDPAEFLAQLAGRSTKIFQANIQLPEAAAQYLREEPEVNRAVANQKDLAEIEANLEFSEATIARLEAVLAAKDRSAVYPALASRRARIGDLQDKLIAMRSQLADKMGSADAQRRSLAAQYAAMKSPERAQADATAQAHQTADALDEQLQEIKSALGSTHAMAVAMRKYDRDMAAAGTPATDVKEPLDEASREAQQIEAELAALERELVLARDLAAVGHEEPVRAREVRKQLIAAQDAEARALAGRGKEGQQLERATRLVAQLAQTETTIDGMVDRAMQEAQQLIAQERTNIVELKREHAALEAESRSLGGTILGASFKDVKARFYDIVIRTDVGTVDVSWAQKEDADDDFKRLNLARQRDLKQLRDEFKGVLDDTTQKPAPRAPEPPPPASDQPTGSPDKGAAGGRVAPGSDKPATTPTPVVRPGLDDNEKPGGTQPKGGGSR